jgi:hypothetical protein
MWTCPKCNERLEDQFESCWKCETGGQEVLLPPPAKAVSWRWLIVLLFVLQIAVVFTVSISGTNLSKIPYRRAERVAAIQAYYKDPSLENKVTMDNERRIASRVVGQQKLMKAGILLVVLLSMEGALYYLWKRRYIKAPFAV